MGQKGKLPPEEEARIGRALAAASGSENNTLQIYNALQDEEKAKLDEDTFKRLVRRRLDPAAECYEEHWLPGYEEGEEVCVYLPRMRPLLQFFAQKAPVWAEALFRCLRAQGDSALRVIVYSDDCTCGNILAARKTKKFSLFYLGVAQMRPHLHHAGAWLLGACAQYSHMERIQGGISAVAARLVRCILNDETRTGFPLACPGTVSGSGSLVLCGSLETMRRNAQYSAAKVLQVSPRAWSVAMWLPRTLKICLRVGQPLRTIRGETFNADQMWKSLLPWTACGRCPVNLWTCRRKRWGTAAWKVASLWTARCGVRCHQCEAATRSCTTISQTE